MMIVGNIYKTFVNCSGGPYYRNRGRVFYSQYILKGTKLIYLGDFVFLDLNNNKMIVSFNTQGMVCLTPHTLLQKGDGENPHGETITAESE